MPRIRTKIWGTDYAPGREDPYSFDSPLREAQQEAKTAAAAEQRKKAKVAAAAAQETKEANVDAAGVAPTPATSTPAHAEGPKRATRTALRVEDASYEPAKTWHGLKWIGGKKNKWRQDEE
ncbi:hypothetical protein SLS55_001318 [Diplodia seriata]|uniref:Uncharacterized protein n=1 Tax=Diplodia seriata TaxID=420778 RepID=A0ABR3CWR2_9PEZI